MLDSIKPCTHKALIEHELEGFGIRLNKEVPNIYFKRKPKGGVNFSATVELTHVDRETVRSVLSEYKIHNCDISLRSDATIDEVCVCVLLRGCVVV